MVAFPLGALLALIENVAVVFTPAGVPLVVGIAARLNAHVATLSADNQALLTS